MKMEEQLSSQVLTWKRKVSQAAKNANLQDIKSLLSGLSSKLVKEILDYKIWKYHTDETPLTIAANCGHLETVELLINHFIADLDKTGTDNFLSRSYEIVLKRAAQHGHMNIVEWLVNRGLDVNQDSNGQGTPLLLACRENRLEVVKYLVDKGADMEAADEYGHDCLMAACLSGEKDLVWYLLEKGADVNRKSHDGKTSLHEATWNNAPQLVELLLQHGATISKDDEGHSPLIMAALWCRRDVVEFFVESSAVCRKEKIDMLELFGARMADEDINMAFRYLHRAMVKRHEDPSEIISKPHSPLLTLTGVTESQTLEELEPRQFDRDTLRLECLATLKRILGIESIYYLRELHNYFLALAEADRITSAVAVLFSGLKDAPIHEEMKTIFSREVIYIFDCLGKMLAKGESPGMPCIANCLELTFLVMHQEVKHPSSFFLQNKRLMNFCLHCIMVGLKVAQGQEKGELLQKLAKRVLRFGPSIPQGCSVLHLAVTCCWNTSNLRGRLLGLPYDLLVSFLLQCGADIHARDADKNTPLHLIAGLNPEEEDDCDFLRRITRTLLEAGALVGVQNSQGKTPLDVAGTEAVKALLRQYVPVSLKSLAATAVVKHEIPYAREVPTELEEFVQCH